MEISNDLLLKLANLLSQPRVITEDGIPFVVIPDDWDIHDVSHLEGQTHGIKETIFFKNKTSFLEYIEAYKTNRMLADLISEDEEPNIGTAEEGEPQVSVILNYHCNNKHNNRLHIAILKCRAFTDAKRIQTELKEEYGSNILLVR